MPSSPLSAVVRQLRAAAGRDGAGRTDGELLTLFLSQRDEDSLAALVERHAPMVWGVCCRVLRNPHDAEDAFQATFLVLVQKASTVVPRERVANWLFGVARQTAARLRAVTAKRDWREVPMNAMPEPAVVEARDEERLSLLDQVLGQLPERHRALIILCDLEGHTRKHVARQLGCPEGTVASGLARARALLAKRLTQRGVTWSSGVLAAVLSQNMAAAGVPSSVVSSTIKAASLLAAGRAAGVVSARVAALTEGVVKAMFVTKSRSVLAVALILGFVAVGATILPHGTAAGPDEKKPVVVPAELPAKRQQKVPDQVRKMRMVIVAKGGRTQVNVVVGDTKYSIEADELEYDEERGSLQVKGSGNLYTQQGEGPATTLKGEAFLVCPNPEKPMSKDPTVGRP